MIQRDSKFGTGGIKRELFGRYVTPREFKHGARDIPFGEGAKLLHVDGINGDNHNDGESWLTAFKTIQAGAVDHAEGWSKIFIKVGTYTENVLIPTGKPNIQVIGEDRDTVIIIPTSGHAVRSQSYNCHFENFTAIGNGATDAGLDIVPHSTVLNVQVGNQNSSGYGLQTASLSVIDRVRTSLPAAYRPSYGIHVRGSVGGEIKNCFIRYANVGIRGRDTECLEWKIHDNKITNSSTYGTDFPTDTEANRIYNNNFISSGTTHVRDSGTNNKWVGNYFDDHTNIDNGFGIATEAYTFTTGSDPRPVVSINGWLGLSFGHTLSDILDDLNLEAFHVSFFFPEDSNETITITAGGAINTFGAWAEIVDNNAVTFSSKIASNIGHISMIGVEDVSVTDKIYMLEIAYGDAKTVVTRHRILVGVGKVTSCQTRVRPLKIPAGETVYYRLKCETGGATALVNLKYHFH